MDDLHCYTCRENSVREAEEHSSLVKNLKKKKIKMGPLKNDSSQTHITKRKKIKPKQDIHIEKKPKI